MTKLPLFRREALDAHKTHMLGDIVLARPLSFALLSACAALLIAVLCCLLALVSYTKRTTVVGQLVLADGAFRVFAPLTGIVGHGQVAEDQAVSQGQPLFALSAPGPAGDTAAPVVVAAPVTGTAVAVTAAAGELVAQGKELATIVPDEGDIVAQLLVPSGAIGFIAPGDPLWMRYQAFPHQKFGQMRGVVQAVSRSAVPALAVRAAHGDAVYRVTVRLPSQSLAGSGRRYRLLPGMAVQADIPQETRRLYEWVLEPLYAARSAQQPATYQ